MERKRLVEVVLEGSALSILSTDVLKIVAEYTIML